MRKIRDFEGKMPGCQEIFEVIKHVRGNLAVVPKSVIILPTHRWVKVEILGGARGVIFLIGAPRGRERAVLLHITALQNTPFWKGD